MQAHTRRAVTRQYLTLPMEWHQRHPTGQLLSNAYSDVEAAGVPIAPLPMALGTVVMMVIAVVQMLLADVVLAVVGLLVFPAVVIANLAYQRLASPLMTHAQGLRAEVSEIAHESFDGAMVVKTLGRETRGDRAVPRTRPTSCATSTSGPAASAAAFDPTLASLPNVGVLVVLVVGVPRVPSGATDAGDVVTGRLPVDHRVVPDPRDRLAARRVPAQRGRLPPYQGRPRARPARWSTATRASPTTSAAPARWSTACATPTTRTRRCCSGVTFDVEPGRTVAIVGADGVRQEHADQAADPARRPRRRRGSRWTASDLRELGPRRAGRVGRAGAADRVPLRRHRARQRHARRRHPRRGRVGGAARLRRPTASWPRSATASTPSWGSAARRCPVGSGSASRWPVRWYAGRDC